MNRSLLMAALWLGLAAAARAETLPNWPMRELAVQSDSVVAAAPVDPAAPGRFKVLRVFLGTALKEGDVFEIDDLSLYDLTVPVAEGVSGRKPSRLAEALLFLGPKKAGAAAPRFALTASGLRALTADGGAYYAEQRRNPGGYVLCPYRRGVQWDDLVLKAAADGAEVRHLRSLKTITDPRRRNQALLDWVEGRRREFGGGLAMQDGAEPSSGWGSVEWDVFDWVFESRVAQDCWAAVRLYAELNQGAIPGLHKPAFGTRAGRDLLLNVALDDADLTGHRVRALELLSLPLTLWPAGWEGQPAVEAMDEKEQTALIDRVTPLLKNPSPAVRIATAHALLEVCLPHADDLKSFRTQRPLPALTAAYKDQPPGPAREALAEAVCAIGGPKPWEELTGNAHGVVVALKDPGCRQAAEVYGWLVVRRADDAIHEQPTLLLERLDKDKVVEKKETPLGGLVRNAPVPEGWQAGAVEYFTFSMAGYAPGVWRMTLKGVAGKDKGEWSSEPRLLQLTPPLPPANPPNADPTRPRIFFDGSAPAWKEAPAQPIEPRSSGDR